MLTTEYPAPRGCCGPVLGRRTQMVRARWGRPLAEVVGAVGLSPTVRSATGCPAAEPSKRTPIALPRALTGCRRVHALLHRDPARTGLIVTVRDLSGIGVVLCVGHGLLLSRTRSADRYGRHRIGRWRTLHRRNHCRISGSAVRLPSSGADRALLSGDCPTRSKPEAIGRKHGELADLPKGVLELTEAWSLRPSPTGACFAGTYLS
jgi:hypothetical protein